MIDWKKRWQQNQIGWHRLNFNQRMIDNLPNLNLNKGDSIFVPLCGKSLDMIYLANSGFKVIGVELSDTAVKDFFAENNLAYKIYKVDSFVVYKSDNITIYQGDIFNFKQEYLQNITAIYDRASLVALSPQLRERYGKLFDGIIISGVSYLLLVLSYEQEKIDGPPFSVDENEIKNIFNNWEITQLASFNDIKHEAKFSNQGLTILNKESYILRKK